MTQPSPPHAPSDKIDVLFVTHNFPRHRDDFAGRFIWRLARELVGQGISLAVLAPHHPGAEEWEKIDDILVHRFRYGPDEKEIVGYRGDLNQWALSSPGNFRATLSFMRAFRRAISRAIDQFQPRVVHAHWWIPSGLLARKAALKRGTKFIVTSHGTDIRMLADRRLIRFLARRVYRAAHEVTTVSTWLKDELSRRFPEVKQKTSVLPMPVDPGPFSPGDPPQNEIPVVLSVARFVEQKRLFDLMDAAEILKSRGRPFRFRLVGEGPLAKELHDRKFVKGLADDVLLIESMPAAELAGEYRRADMVVLYSQDEGFGMTLVEAQLCGRATIGARSGGITDIIDDGVSGLLVEPGNPSALADAIEMLIVDVKERDRLAQEGLTSARARFDPAQVARRFAELYQLSD